VIEILDDFIVKAEERHITVKVVSKTGIVADPSAYFNFINKRRIAS
jgi:hypothetical protein